MTFLIGDKVRLTKFTDQFVNAKYIGWLNDQEVNKYMFAGRMPISKEEIGSRNDYCNVMFAMMSNIHQDNNEKLWEDDNFSEFVGTISINAIDWINRKGEIGYMIGEKSHWGVGIASDAVKLMSDYALHRLNLHKVEAGVIGGNAGSIRVLEKNGFKKYCVVPSDHWVDGGYKDAHRFYKLQEW